MERDLVVLLAIGTVGDVVPVLNLAKRLIPRSQCTLITHHEHQGWLRTALAGSEVGLGFVTAPPARVWNEAAELCSSEARTEETSQEERLEEHLQACMSALALSGKKPVLGNFASSEEAQPGRRRLLVHNLFAMEAFSIAEALGVPSLAVSACLVPQAAPASLQRRFRRVHPALHAALTRPEQEGPGLVRWADVEHWLWPLFSNASCTWRQERLSLGVPFAGGVLPPAPRLLYLLSPCLTQELSYWPASVKLCGHALEQVDVRPSAQPEARLAHEGAQLGGTAAAPACSPPQASSAELAKTDPGAATSRSCISHTVETVLNSASSAAHPACESRKRQAAGKAVPGDMREECKGPRLKAQRTDWPVLIDFGSVGCMGLLGSASAFLKRLQTALELAGLEALLLTGQWKALQAACAEEGESPDSARLRPVHGFVDHSEHLRSSSMVVHSGGMGIMLAALLAGLPAVACPVHFDQHQNADLLEHLGLGAQVPGRLLAHGDADEAAARLAAAMRAVSASATTRGSARSMQMRLREEDGAAAAAAIVQESAAATRHMAPVRQAALQQAHAVTLPNGWRVSHGSPAEASFIYREIFEERCYMQHGIRVHDGSICVDVGANVGFFTLFLLGGFGGGVPRLVISCEPAPATSELLRRNVEACGIAQKVRLWEKALGQEAATSDLTFYPRMPGNSTLHPSEKALLQADSMPAAFFSAAEVHATSVVTLNDVLEGHDCIDILKIDAEGAELEILKGAGKATLSKVWQIVLEVHDIGDRPLQVQQLLQSAGYSMLGRQQGACHTVLLYAARTALLS
ncbi:hypothetical protein CVIRNUC_002916 [Coccomyxa viridis]|uniref:Methyltransferase FkbM domain-containing protein n=1 Tax=Coccomyxa viridis TaxID=1274662 RepID=A0AAV1HYR5_9CHLO|nr:hypothetical protein CVIRNUC_002916 [Coccomyxa viridis]